MCDGSNLLTWTRLTANLLPCEEQAASTKLLQHDIRNFNIRSAQVGVCRSNHDSLGALHVDLYGNWTLICEHISMKQMKKNTVRNSKLQ